jgi:hypothetical protein
MYSLSKKVAGWVQVEGVPFDLLVCFGLPTIE